MKNSQKTIVFLLSILILAVFCCSPVLADLSGRDSRDSAAFLTCMSIFLVPAAIFFIRHLNRTSFFGAFKIKNSLFYKEASLKKLPHIHNLFSQVTSSEGFSAVSPDDYQDLHHKIAKGPHAEELLNGFPLPGFSVVFKREKPDNTMFLCYTYDSFVLFLFSETAVFPENIIVKNDRDFRGTGSSSFGPGVNLVVRPLAAYRQDTSLPDAIREIISRNDGTYPVGKELRFIFLGKGGICIAAKDSDRNQDVFNLIKFSRDLAGLLEESGTSV